MNSNNVKSQAPILRFPEFRGTKEWEQKQLSELFLNRQETGYTTLSLLSLTEKEGIIPQEELNRKNNSSSDKSKYLRVCPGDIAYNTMRMWEGRSAYVGQEGVVSPAYTVCQPKIKANGLFFSYFFKTPQLVKQFRRYSQGLVNDTLNLKYQAFSQIDVHVPALTEQQKIADCLTSIDDLITVQTQKIDALKEHKRSLTQQLFPAAGEMVPKLRFPEYTDTEEWEQKLLKHTCRMQAGKFVSASEIQERNNDLFPCYGGNGLRGFTKSYTHIGKFAIIGRQGALCGNVKLATGKFHATEHAVVATPKDGIDTDWLYHTLIHLNLNQYATGQAQPGLSVENLEKVELRVPKKKIEQQKIAECLSTIDDLVLKEDQKLDALREHKKGLMQQLFPNIGE